MKAPVIFNEVLKQVFVTDKVTDQEGKERIVDDRISEDEARILYNTVLAAGAGNTAEVGMAYGVSALAICQAHRDTSSTFKHVAVDPNQFTHYKGAALVSLQKAGLDKYVEILEGPSHMKVPELIEKDFRLRMAFIDGWHTFDYTLVDFFLIDKILEPGGYVAFHDSYGIAKQKVVKFIMAYRKYAFATDVMKFDKEPFMKTMKFFLWRIKKHPRLLFSRLYWKFQFKNSSGLIVLKKLENFEPPFDFYRHF